MLDLKPGEQIYIVIRGHMQPMVPMASVIGAAMSQACFLDATIVLFAFLETPLNLH